MLKLTLLLSLMLLDIPPTADDFVPKDIIHAVAFGCSVGGYDDPQPYAETQVFVKWTKEGKKWDFSPIMSRRSPEQGGALKAADDCIEWLGKVKQRLQKASHGDKEASK